MKRKNIKLMFLLLLATDITGAQAQTLLNVQAKSGKLTSFDLSSIHTLIFNSGTMTVNKRDGNALDFAMADVQNLNFSNITSSDETPSASGKMSLYPNPAKDHLQISYESTTEENVSVTIINIQGTVVFQQKTISQTGTNQMNIPIFSLQNGMYLCKFQKGIKIEMTKFIKN